jgi:hypothetical protein
MRVQMSILFTALLIFGNLAYGQEPEISVNQKRIQKALGFLLANKEEVAPPSKDQETTETELVKQVLQKSVGRIVSVSTYKDAAMAISTCSAVLVQKNVIATSAHCVLTKANLTAQEQAEIAAAKQSGAFKEEKYFDIPGITSNMSPETMAALMQNGNSAQDANLLKDYIARLPKITNFVVSDYHRANPYTIYDIKPTDSYSASLTKSQRLRQQNRNAELLASDYAFAKLDRPVVAGETISIIPYNEQSITYVAGFGGRVLNNFMQVFTCSSGPVIIDPYIEAKTIEKNSLEANISHLNDAQKAQLEPLVLYEINSLMEDLSLLNLYDQKAVVSECNGLIVGGFSGGGQFTYVDGNVAMVGITSLASSNSVFKTATTAVGAKAQTAIDAKILERLK